MSIAETSLQPRSAPANDVIRVMIVDDAIVVRGLLVRWIEAEAGLQVVASLRSGREAIEQVDRANPDVVILDVDMPDIDGITALPRLFEKRRDLVVIMSSTLTRRNAEVSLRALSLGAIVGGIGGVIDQVPVLITQHMPPTFTTILAEILERAAGRPAQEAIEGEAFHPGRIYIAPGGRHLRAVRRNGGPAVALDDGPPINYCKPAVDPMFSSAAAAWGSANLALVLTGMGSDGLRGAGDVIAAGGSVIAQDEETSVVWGMPGSVTKAGLCSAVLALDQIAAKLNDLFCGARS